MVESESAFKHQTQIVQHVVALLQHVENHLESFAQQPVAQMDDSIFLHTILSRISWSHHIILIDKEPDLGKRFWYMLNTIEHGISRNILAMHIESDLFGRQIAGKK